MSAGERIAPAAAALGALSTLLCCLPLSFAAALGAAGLSVIAIEYRSWLIGFAVILLAVGFIEVYRRPSDSCRRRSSISIAILWCSALLVAIVFLMPQLVAALLADWLG